MSVERIQNACRVGDIQTVREFVSNKNNDLNQRDQTHFMRYLYIACINHQYDIAKLLLENGADPNLESNLQTVVCIDVMCERGYYDMVELLLKHNALIKTQFGSALHTACQSGKIDIVQLLTNHGADVNDFMYGKTPLDCACIGGHLDVVKFLVKNGANVFSRNAFGDTPVMVAQRYNHHEIIAFLEKQMQPMMAHL